MTDVEAYVAREGRDEQIKQVREKIDELDIDYIYYQYISITGRIMGKSVSARHWENVAKEGIQCWYGGVTNVFADRSGALIGFPSNASELLGIPDPETFCQLPWNKRMGRVYCTVFRNREESENPGAFLDDDSRGNLRRIHEQFKQDHDGLH